MWPPFAQADSANPNSRAAIAPQRRLLPAGGALAARRPDPLCIDFPAGSAACVSSAPARNERGDPPKHPRINGTRVLRRV
jgi:hypothetical protein